MQRSQQGWQVADALLQSEDTNVRFFGALTFTIKINQDWNSLNEADATQLLYRLVEWLIQLTKSHESALVLRKLCSALIAYYLRPSGAWQQSIRHLLISFNAGRPIVLDRLSAERSPTSSLVETLNGTQRPTILWFASGLVEEVNKADSASIQSYKYYERVSTNVADVVDLLHHSIGAASRGDFGLAEHGVKCFQVCSFYPFIPSIATFHPKDVAVIRLQNLFQECEKVEYNAFLCNGEYPQQQLSIPRTCLPEP